MVGRTRATAPLLALPLLLLTAALAAPAPAAAEDGGAQHFPHGTWNLQVENDRIARTDRHYTNGLRLSWVSDGHTHGPDWARKALQYFYPWAHLREGRIGFAVGHNMYTPEDTESSQLVRNDRPYAGWLYGTIGLQAESTRYWNQGEQRFDVIDTVEVSLGVVGPAAFGEEVQNQWHDIIDVARSNGWDNQLENEPAINFAFQRRWRPGHLEIFDTGLAADFIPSLGGSIGNVFTLANAGLILRFGSGLDIDYGPPLIRPSLSPLAALREGPEFAWYVFAGGNGRAVARNIFLDGNTFEDSHSVDKKTFVGDFIAGFAIAYKGTRLAFTHVMRTREFSEQSEPDRFGALVLSTRF